MSQITGNLSEVLESTRIMITAYNFEYLEESKLIENALIFNNACWMIGEVGQRIPQAIKGDVLISVVKIIGDMLDQNIQGKLSENPDLGNHF